MIDIKSMGYVRVASTDLDRWKLFAGKVLGLAEGRGPNPDHQYWRIDQVSARLVVFPSDVDQLDVVGWEVADPRACLQGLFVALYAGGHYLSDLTAGAFLGTAIGDYALHRAAA